jgi:hypothetical protein
VGTGPAGAEDFGGVGEFNSHRKAMASCEMVVPNELLELINAGKWPQAPNEINGRNMVIFAQEKSPLITRERVQVFAPDESLIILYPPPFQQLYVDKLALDFFLGTSDESSPPGDLDFSKCLVISDFGMGSDSPIVLDYRSNLENPRVLRLRCSRIDNRWHNRWVTIAPIFREFAVLLGLLE